ncbi:MAG: asparagine synthase (glutamine-hydrolyzing) [Phycisphaerales bacterium]
MLARPPTESIPPRWLDILDDAVKHRGPDGAGRFRDRVIRRDGSLADVALVHRRLAIIDPADGHQPMVSLARGQGVLPPPPRALHAGDGLAAPTSNSLRPGDAPIAPPDRVAVVFNGCVYNHRRLRDELQAAGHAFSTDHSDTEVLVHGWREWGTTLGEHLDGMAALLVWDAAAGTLSALRDRFGEKPLYFFLDDAAGTYVFSSSVPGLLRLMPLLGRADAAIPSDALTSHWIAMGYHAHRTPLAYVNQVPAGAILTVPGNQWSDLDRVAQDEWTRRAPGEFRRGVRSPVASDSLVKRLEALLHDAVNSRLESDVPLACLLSGGVDSSLVSLMASGNGKPLTTICVRMPDDRYDESPYAEQAARIIGSTHRTIDASAQPADDLVGLIAELGLPFGDSSLLPSLWACAAARQHATVLLSGDGGDELFLGYERYQAAKWLDPVGSLPFGLPGVLELGAGRHPKSRLAKLARLARAERGEGYADLLAIFDFRDRSSLLGRIHASLSHPGPRPSSAVQAQRAEFLSHFPGDLLRKSDTASMSVGVELRAPLLARELADHALALSPLALMPRGRRKGLLRAVARLYFPSHLVDRPKMGFAIPIGEWFRSNFGGMRDLLLSHLDSPEPFGPDSLGINSMINMDAVRTMLMEHDHAGANSLWPWKGRDHSQRLYMLLVLSIWAGWLAGVHAD